MGQHNDKFIDRLIFYSLGIFCITLVLAISIGHWHPDASHTVIEASTGIRVP